MNVMHSTRLEALSFTNNHKRQCGSYLFAIGTRHAVMSASVCRNYEQRSGHRGIRVVVGSDVVGAPRSMMMRNANPPTACACFMLMVPLMA